MAVPLLDNPPADGLGWVPKAELHKICDRLGIPRMTVKYTLGRNDGKYATRAKRKILTTHIRHTMGGYGTESMAGFAMSETGSSATLAEAAVFEDGSILFSLPFNVIGAGSVAGSANGITCETSELAGDPNVRPWTDPAARSIAVIECFMITNPLNWSWMQVPFQICKSPYPTTKALGGIGCHTMWGLGGISNGGTNPWTLVKGKSCPGWYRRGNTQRNILFPTGNVTDIPDMPGNFRNLYYLTANYLTRLDQGPVIPPDIPPVKPPVFIPGSALALPPITEVDVSAVRFPFVVKEGKNAVWMTNGVQRWWVPSELALKQAAHNLGLVTDATWGMTHNEILAKFVRPVGDLTGYGAVVGPDPGDV